MVTMRRMTRLLPDSAGHHTDDGSEKGQGAPWPGVQRKAPQALPAESDVLHGSTLDPQH